MATLIENVNRIYTDKEAIKQVIIEKGVAVPEETSLDEYANLIAQINGGIDTSTVTATADDVLAGKVIVDANGNEITGTLNDYSETNLPVNDTTAAITSVNQNQWTNSTGSGATLSFHPNFSGYVTPNTTINQNVYGLNPSIVKAGELIGGNGSPSAGAIRGTYTSDATAAAGNILSGKTAYVNGSKVTGTMTNYGREPVAGGISQYNNDLYLYVPNYSENIEASGCIQRGIHTPLSNLGNATASKVLTGNTFTSSAGLKITGTIASKAAATYTPGTTNQTIASGQYLSGAQTIKGDANLVAANIKKGTSIFGITGNYNGAVNVYSNFCSIEAGTWSGATLKDTAYVNLASSSITSEWIYNHNLSLDLEKIKFIVGSFIYPSDVDYALRFSRGYASSSTTAQYWYRTQMTAFGSADIGFTTEEYGSNVHVYGEGFIYEGALYKDYKLGASINGDAVKILSGIAAYYYIDTKNIGNNAGIMEVYVTENQISFKFIHNGANPVAIRGLKPRFAFMIGYTD